MSLRAAALAAVVVVVAVAVAVGGTSPSSAAPDPREKQKLYVEPAGAAYDAAKRARAAGKVSIAKELEVISKRAQGHWVGDWYSATEVRADVRRYTRAAKKAKRTPVIVVYAIPGRDCGGHSAGGLTKAAYKTWIRAVAKGLRDGRVGSTSRALVVLEPDALALDCVGEGRFALLKFAAKELAATGAWVYLDAGHSRWLPAKEAAKRLKKAGVAHARGFATNVSNFNSTTKERAYGNRVSAQLKRLKVKLAHRHFVVDTSRNGKGPAKGGEWCNPAGRGLGDSPRMVTSVVRLDALLWVKRPGESDGSCNGGPGAGQWWQDYALELVKNRKK